MQIRKPGLREVKAQNSNSMTFAAELCVGRRSEEEWAVRVVTRSVGHGESLKGFV